MDNQKKLKPLSERFQVKSKKELENACTKFSLNLQNEISRYLCERAQGSESTGKIFRLLQTSLESTKEDVEISESVNTQSKMICSLVATVEGSADSPCLNKVLKKLLFYGCFSDIILKVENEAFLCHKDILCARSSYFIAMLQTKRSWSEASGELITLGGLTAKSFAVYLCHLYGVFVDCPMTDRTETVNLVQAADMLGSDDMKDALILFMQRDKCHFFHKPCPDCIDGLPMVLQISEQFCLDKLQRKCVKWNTSHFSRLWPTKKFCSLSGFLQEKCYIAVTESMNSLTVVNITLETDELTGRLTLIKWALPAIRMANRLLSVCEDFISQHLFQLTESQRIFPLFVGMGCRSNLIEEIATKASTSLSASNACAQHLAVRKLMTFAEKEQWNPTVVSCFKLLDQRITTFLTSNYYAIIHSTHWDLLSSDYKATLRATTMCQGDPDRKPRHKPVLTSSAQQHRKPQPGKSLKKKTKLKSTEVAAKPGLRACTHIPLLDSPKPTPEHRETLVDRQTILVNDVPLATNRMERDAKTGPLLNVSVDHQSTEEAEAVAPPTPALLQCLVTHEVLCPPLVVVPPTVFRPYSLNDPVLNKPVLVS